MQMLDIGRVLKLVLGPAQRERFVVGVEGPALDTARNIERSFPRTGRDADDTADGIGSIQSALRPAQHLDALDVRGQQLAEIEARAGIARVAHVDAVDEHLGMIGIRAAHEDRGLPPGPPDCTTFSPGTSCRTSVTVRNWAAAMSAAVITVTLLPICAAGVAMRVAETITFCSGSAALELSSARTD